MYFSLFVICVLPRETDWQLMTGPGVLSWVGQLLSEFSLFAAFRERGAIFWPVWTLLNCLIISRRFSYLQPEGVPVHPSVNSLV